MITFFVAPPTQVYAPPLACVEHPLAPEVMAAVRQRGPTPVGLWRVINDLANARNPDHRARLRCWRLRFWGACRELLKANLLVRHGPLISTSDFATTLKPGTPDRGISRRSSGELRLSPSGSALTSETSGSNSIEQQAQPAAKDQQPVERKTENKIQGTLTSTAESETAPTPELVSIAARQLARLPRRGVRRWSGWITDDVRSYRNMRVALPNGEQVFVFGVLRGQLVYTREANGPVGARDGIGTSWGVIRASAARIIKNEHAIALGKRKAGAKEKFSPRKAEAARRNGAMPVRRERPRGRPARRTH